MVRPTSPNPNAKFELIRDADVQVKPIYTGKGGVRHVSAEITVNDKFQHRFTSNSRVSKHLELMSAEQLQERLSGGSFFFIDDELVDFRDGTYNGFIHTDESVSKFMETIGYRRRDNMPLHRRRRNREGGTNATGKIQLGNVWSQNEIDVPGYKAGGEFSSQLSFVWNPYVKTINSSFDLIRLICTNGMVGLTSFLNNKIPLMNRWEEHLDIASRQIQNKVNDIVIERVGAMSKERASVADCLLLEQHILDRLTSPQALGDMTREQLMAMMVAVSPKEHLEEYYTPAALNDRRLAGQLPSHLTNFDVFNVATEIRSHSEETANSSNNALDRFANGILFDRQDNYLASAARMGAGKLAAFSDVDRAFFGDTSIN